MYKKDFRMIARRVFIMAFLGFLEEPLKKRKEISRFTNRK
jgi:hypothetical protein